MTKTIFGKPLIGKKVKIVSSSNPLLIKIRGIVVDESAKMLTIRTKEKEVKVPKKTCLFDFVGYNQQVEGESILGTPEERIKKSV